MALDAYSSCPCGSGKKFKWCCQPIHHDIDKAFQQDSEGQHDVALKLMEGVVAAHPENPEVWGRQAQLLYQNGKEEEAEAALEKAFALNPRYPSGLLLRGLFRFNEGELPGALLLFRRAAEAFDPEAKDFLGQTYSLIAECELKLNRPVAARVALLLALHYRPASEEVRKGLESLVGDDSRLPLAARRDYRFLSPAAGVSGDRRLAWDKALEEAMSPRLADAARVFEQLTKDDAGDAAAWFNLGVARAWLGDNAGGLVALDHYVALEADEGKAADAWALGEVLRYGHGLEDQADVQDLSVVYQIRDPRPIPMILQDWGRAQRLIGVRTSEEQGMLSGIVLDNPTALVSAVPPPAGLGAYLLIAGNILRLSNVNREALGRVRQEVQQRLGAALSEPREQVGQPPFHDLVLPALVFPVNVPDQAAAEILIRDHAQRYFEDTWVHKPLKTLSGVPPIDAAGHGTLRKKLAGVIEFLQQCASGGALASYDFDRLRRKLGLTGASAAASAAVGAAAVDIGAMGAAELAGLNLESLPDDQLEQAYQAAQKLDAHELAQKVARVVVGRPPAGDKTDRYPYYSYLVQRALAEGNKDEALDLVNVGERVDCEHNGGLRRNDYELRRAQVHAKRGDANEARDVFGRLIERAPDELRYRGAAAEAMLSLKQPALARQFAEEGLARARQKNDRDSEGYLMELAAAAKKQGG